VDGGDIAHDLVFRKAEVYRIIAQESLDVCRAGDLIKTLLFKCLEVSLADMRAGRNRVQ
jgi:hypothetical protein